MPTMNVSLTEEIADFVEGEVASGDYVSASEVVREAMRRYIAEDTKLEALRRELQKGLDSGPARPFDWDDFMERKFGPAGDD